MSGSVSKRKEKGNEVRKIRSRESDYTDLTGHQNNFALLQTTPFEQNNIFSLLAEHNSGWNFILFF